MGVAAKAGWRLFGTVSGVAAAFAARKAVDLVWRRAVGHEPPAMPESPETRGAEAFAWIVLSGLAGAAARLLATRKAAAAWRGSTGHLPPGLEAS